MEPFPFEVRKAAHFGEICGFLQIFFLNVKDQSPNGEGIAILPFQADVNIFMEVRILPGPFFMGSLAMRLKVKVTLAVGKGLNDQNHSKSLSFRPRLVFWMFRCLAWRPPRMIASPNALATARAVVRRLRDRQRWEFKAESSGWMKEV